MLRARAAHADFPPGCVPRFREALAGCGVMPGRPCDILPAHDLASRLIGGVMATPDTISRVHLQTKGGLFVVREQGAPMGVLAFLLLSDAGHEALLAGSLDTLAPAPGHLASEATEPAAVYSWAIAAANHGVAQRLVRGHERVRHEAVPDLAFYLRPVTPQGRRLAEVRLGFKPLPGSNCGLFWSQPRAELVVEAAA